MQAWCLLGVRNRKRFLPIRTRFCIAASQNALILSGASGASGLTEGVRMPRRLRLVLAGAFSVLAVLLCVLYGQRTRAEAERERAEAIERYGGEVTQVVVALQPLEAGDVLTRQNVTERDWVSDLVPQGTLTSLDEALGRQVTVPAGQGSPLTALNFRTEGGTSEVPDGYVAISLSASEKLGLPMTVPTGTRLAAFRVTDSGARLVTSDLQVLALASEAAVGTRGTVTLAVRPDDVSELLVAGGEGSLRLIVPGDGAKVTGQLSAPSEVTAEPGAANDSGTAASEAGEAEA